MNVKVDVSDHEILSKARLIFLQTWDTEFYDTMERLYINDKGMLVHAYESGPHSTTVNDVIRVATERDRAFAQVYQELFKNVLY